MFPRSAPNLAVAVTRWQPAPACVGRSPRQNPVFSKLSRMKSNELISGVLLVDKGPGMTSHDVVAVARRCLNMKKIGHCGTLDPMATGMLILVIWNATRIQDLLMSEDKEYTGTATLGRTTNTQDREGQTLEEKPVPAITREQIT